MSERERFTNLSEQIPDDALPLVMLWLERHLDEWNEAVDDAQCIAMNDAYLANPDKGEGTPIEVLAERWGVQLP